MKKNLSSIVLLAFFLLFFAGCATVASSVNPAAGANILAQNNGFEKEVLTTSYFKLRAFSKFKKTGAPLTIYIEGDGLAWISKSRLSEDPTPHNPLVLTLASRDETENVAYLARPCQYVLLSEETHYNSQYWSTKRFSEEVIQSMNEAVDQLKNKSGAKNIRLVGYSGGGAVAALIAARRNDVDFLCTIAGNLDHVTLNRHHHVTQMTGSLNPIDYAEKISHIRQQHFVGENDQVVPSLIAQKFIERSNNPALIKITNIPGATHDSGWMDTVAEYLKKNA